MRQELALAVLVSVAILFAAPAAAGMFGPDKFKITQSDGRFSANGETTFAGHNNRISSKSVVGGRHIDDKGMFIDPMVTKDAQGRIVSLSLIVMNLSDEDTLYGSPNLIGTPSEIAFSVSSGPPFLLPITEASTDQSNGTSYNTVTRSTSSAVVERGIANLTPEQFLTIANATIMAVKITGRRRSVTYEARDLAPSFIGNLKSFYGVQIQTHPPAG